MSKHKIPKLLGLLLAFAWQEECVRTFSKVFTILLVTNAVIQYILLKSHCLTHCMRLDATFRELLQPIEHAHSATIQLRSGKNSMSISYLWNLPLESSKNFGNNFKIPRRPKSKIYNIKIFVWPFLGKFYKYKSCPFIKYEHMQNFSKKTANLD